jgi:hypothetical protein
VQGATAVQGTWTIARNTLIRNGNSDFNWNFGVGAIWFSALNESFSSSVTINITDTDILDSSYAALHWIEGQTRGINLNNVNIVGAGTYALQVQAASQVSFTNVRASGIAQANPMHNCVGSGFQITRSGTNTGWFTDTPFCGEWPTPQWNNGPTSPPGTSPATNPPTTTPPTTTPPTTTPPTTIPPTTPPTATPPTTTPPTTPPTTTPPTNSNLAASKPVTASSVTQSYVAANANDGNAASYWESANGAFPQTFTADLGQASTVGRLVLKLPPGWEARTQTLSVAASTDGTSYATIVNPADYRFDPATANTVTIGVPAGTHRYLRLNITANTGWPAGQLSEFEVYGS